MRSSVTTTPTAPPFPSPSCPPIDTLAPSLPPPSPLRYVIATHVRYQDATLPVLLPTLTDCAGIAPEDILVVSGGYDARLEYEKGGVRHIGVTHNSFDHTGLIELLDGDHPGDYWFALHDTCTVGPRFRTLAEQFDPHVDFNGVNGQGWLNMGTLSRAFIERLRPYLFSLRNCSKARAIMSERLFARMGQCRPYGSGSFDQWGMRYPYGTGTPRLAMYFPSLDLVKYQANFHGTANGILDV